MALRTSLDLELVPLLKALRSRLDGMNGVSKASRDGVEVHSVDQTDFMQLEIRRDHMNLDLWLTAEKLEEARASGIGRAHPFMENEAVKVRFERAEDLTKVAHWLEEAYRHALDRSKKAKRSAAAKKAAATKKNGATKEKAAKQKVGKKS